MPFAVFFKGRTAAAGIAAINMIWMVGCVLVPTWMGVARDLTGDYRRGLLTLALPSARLGQSCFMLG